MRKIKKGGGLKSNTLRSMIKGSGFRPRQGNPEDDSGVELPTLNEHFGFRPRQGPPEYTSGTEIPSLNDNQLENAIDDIKREVSKFLDDATLMKFSSINTDTKTMFQDQRKLIRFQALLTLMKDIDRYLNDLEDEDVPDLRKLRSMIRKLQGYDIRDLPQEQALQLEAMLTRLTEIYERVQYLLSMFTSRGRERHANR